MQVKLAGDKLVIELSPIEKILALKKRLVIPIKSIVAVKYKRPRTRFRIRFPGTWIPFLVTAGTYYVKEGKSWEKEFWLAFRGARLVTLELENSPYKRIIVPGGEWVEDCIPSNVPRA